MSSTRQLISSEKFPPKPHNSPATKVPGLVFCAGQTATGEIRQATVRRRVVVPMLRSEHAVLIRQSPTFSLLQRTVLQNLKEVLELAGSSLEQVVKYNVYLADMKDFAAMNEEYIKVCHGLHRARLVSANPRPSPLVLYSSSRSPCRRGRACRRSRPASAR